MFINNLLHPYFPGRKSVDETPALANSSQQQQQHSIPGSATGSPQRVANKRSSITVNMPAAGLGQRPPSIISTASQDEGGFNESTPELKAKLQPAYDQREAEEQPHSLNYVDVGYRLNPDGSESREVYGSEAELYDTAKVSDMQRKFHGANGFGRPPLHRVAAVDTAHLSTGIPSVVVIRVEPPNPHQNRQYPRDGSFFAPFPRPAMRKSIRYSETIEPISV